MQGGPQNVAPCQQKGNTVVFVHVVSVSELTPLNSCIFMCVTQHKYYEHYLNPSCKTRWGGSRLIPVYPA